MKPEAAVGGARELATFERHRAELERKYPGRIALMHEDELLGVFKALEKAIPTVLKRFGGPEQCYWQEIGKRVHMRPMWGAWGPDPDEPPPPPRPPPEVQYAREFATYERHRAELERDHWGEFAIIRGDEVVALFQDEDEAVDEGDRRFGLGNFILCEIGDPVYDFPNCLPPDGTDD